MIELQQYPTQEDFLTGVARCVAQVQEALGDIQYLAKRFSDGNYYMTAEQVADYLKCTVDEIPTMPKYGYYPSKNYRSLYCTVSKPFFMEFELYRKSIHP